MPKADEDRVRPRPEGDHACGPYFAYLEEEAELDRKARFLPEAEMPLAPAERSWEREKLNALHQNNPATARMVLKAFWIGRASACRERKHGAAMVREAMQRAFRLYQKSTAEVFSKVISDWSGDHV